MKKRQAEKIVENAVTRAGEHVKAAKSCPFCGDRCGKRIPCCPKCWILAEPSTRTQWRKTFSALGIRPGKRWADVVRQVGVQEAGERLRLHHHSSVHLYHEVQAAIVERGTTWWKVKNFFGRLLR